MKTIRIGNLRSIIDTGDIDIKPITILIVKNNSGKSTFLRLFSLLRQSVESRTRSPLLWYGQYVDYGSFKNALRRGAEDSQITLAFSYALSQERLEWYIPRRFEHLRTNALKDQLVSVEIRLATFGEEERTYIPRIELTIGKDKIILEIDMSNKVTKFFVNDLDIIAGTESYEVSDITKFIPMLHTINSEEEQIRRPSYYYYNTRLIGGVDVAVSKRIEKLIKPHFHANTKESTIKSHANRICRSRISYSAIDKLLEYMKSFTGPQRMRNYANSLTIDSPELKEIMNLCTATLVPLILQSADDELIGVARNVRTIAPVRATTERYYRKQDLAIDEVDYKGQNLPMYLGGLTQTEKTIFQKWTSDNFGFEVTVTDKIGHVELSISETKDGPKYNLADSGFGFSQVLPIVAQLWSIARSRKSQEDIYETRIITIEQPELHLHPGFQAKVADMFVAAVTLSKEEKVNLRIVLETHSEAMVNRIGQLISKGLISEKDVNVVIFEKKEPDDSTEVSIANYDSKGYLENWPFGFFQP